MFNFKDVSALRSLLTDIHQAKQGRAGSELLSEVLQRDLQFTAEQARRYSSWLLTRDADDSADCVYRNARKLIGTWSRGNSDGTAGNLVVSRTESWIFAEDLTYENKNESYEGLCFAVWGRLFAAENLLARRPVGPQRPPDLTLLDHHHRREWILRQPGCCLAGSHANQARSPGFGGRSLREDVSRIRQPSTARPLLRHPDRSRAPRKPSG